MTTGGVLFGLALVIGFIGVDVSRHGNKPGLGESLSFQEQPGEISILVTVHPVKTKALPEIRAEDFAVKEDGRRQTILSAKRASEAPINLAVLIQDDVVSRVGNEIEGTRKLIRSLPSGSRVMTGYITTGTLQVTQVFTADLNRAAASLRIPRASSAAAPFNPYIEVLEALRRFGDQPPGRDMILLVSDGLDVSQGFRSASPWLSIDLDRAINEAQRRRVAVFPIYAPTVGLTSVSHLATNYGQGSLNRLADETGGEAFFHGWDFVTFDPFFKEFKELLDRQWLITYRSDNPGKGTHRIEVTTELRDVHIYHQVGYTIK